MSAPSQPLPSVPAPTSIAAEHAKTPNQPIDGSPEDIESTMMNREASDETKFAIDQSEHDFFHDVLEILQGPIMDEDDQDEDFQIPLIDFDPLSIQDAPATRTRAKNPLNDVPIDSLESTRCIGFASRLDLGFWNLKRRSTNS